MEAGVLFEDKDVSDDEGSVYRAAWDAFGFDKEDREAAYRVVDLFTSLDSDYLEFLNNPYPYRSIRQENRANQRQAAHHYRTLAEIKEVAQNDRVVEELIHRDFLDNHSKWDRYVSLQNPQIPYRINEWLLDVIRDELEAPN